MNTSDALRSALTEVDAYYQERGIFQDKFGFGAGPALIVIDMAYGWTDPRRECEGLREGVTLAQCAHADGKPD